MPNIKKVEYNRLKITEAKYYQISDDYSSLILRYLDTLEEVKKWKRYYEAVRETFKIEETVDMPGCFNPMDTIEYIVKNQTDVNDAIDRLIGVIR